MARGKKQNLSVEELLEHALVSEYVQPYEVPANWLWTKAEYGFDITSSKRVHKHEWKEAGIPFYRTRELVVLSEKGYVQNELFIDEGLYQEYKKSYGVPQINDLLISGVGTIGVPYVVDNEDDFYFKDGNIIWFQNRGLFIAEYTFYLYKSLFMKNQLQDFSSGTTVDTYTIINAKLTKFPLPPIAEQQRIVARIENLFAKLDQAKELAQNALDSFETRKAAVLHKAFTGELTAKWREEHGVSMDSWEEKSLGEKFIVAGGIQKTPARAPRDNPVPYLSVANVLRGELALDEIKYFEVTQIELQSLILRKNDLLVVEGNGSAKEIGRCAIWNDEISPCIHQNHIIRLRVNGENVNSQFILYYLNSERGKEIMKSRAVTTAGLYNLSTGKIRDIEAPFPSLPEQQEIVRILDSLFEKETRVKELCNVIEKIDLMKKAILARAFRGELGTNDPKDENAFELLKEVVLN